MEEEKEREIEIRWQDFLDVFKKCWWVMLLVFVAAFVSIFSFLTVRHVDNYTATVSFYVMDNSAEGSYAGSYDYNTADVIISDLPTWLESKDKILRPALEEALPEGGMTVEELSRAIGFSNKSGTHAVTLSVTTDDPDKSERLAIAVYGKLKHYADYESPFQVRDKKDQNSIISDMDTVDREETAKVSNPVSVTKVFLLAVASAVVVYGIFFLAQVLDDRIRSEEDVDRYLQINLLGTIPNAEEASGSKRKKYYYYESKHKEDNANENR